MEFITSLENDPASGIAYRSDFRRRHAFLEQHQGENVYRRIVCEGRTAERSCGSWDVNCRESVCGFPAAKSFFKQI